LKAVAETPDTVTTRVAVALEQPPEPGTVYVIVAVPPLIADKAPVVELMVAIVGSEEDQVPPEMDEVRVLVEPAHTVFQASEYKVEISVALNTRL
jgi:hypothetical protein